MLKIVIVAENPFEPETWERAEVPDVRDYLLTRFKEWPSTARIYHKQVAADHDVTPSNEETITRLGFLEGPFYVVVYPADPATIIIAAVATAAAIACAFLFRPEVPPEASRDRQRNPSPNNSLSDRQNKPRLNGRIPDIFGQVRSYPDLLAPPYKVFENNIEVEYSFMCVGRGTYDISDVREDTSPLNWQLATAARFFGPNVAPNSGTPQLVAGTDFSTEKVCFAKRYSSIDGQILEPDNAVSLYDIMTIGVGTNAYKLYLRNDSSYYFTEHFQVGDYVKLEGPDAWGKDSTGATIPLTGIQYQVTAVSDRVITLYALQDCYWQNIFQQSTTFPRIAVTRVVYEYGKVVHTVPFDLGAGTRYLYLNLVAPKGLYKLGQDSTQWAQNVEVKVKVTALDVNQQPIGAPYEVTGVLIGNKYKKDQIAKTMKVQIGAYLSINAKYYKVEVQRTTLRDTYWAGPSNVDEVRLRDLYMVTELEASTHYGNVTTVFVRSVATQSAMSIKSRKLNCLAYRKIPTRIGTTNTFTTTLSAVKDAANIFCAAALDPYIGNRTNEELDVDNIYNTKAEISSYFGTAAASEFSYTFDTDLSYEETAAIIAGAVYCTAYRRGSLIKLSFEKETPTGTLLFNHRNKVPGSETRSVRFGFPEGNDGIEYTYVDPTDDAVVTLTLPNLNVRNPKKIESLGVRHPLQAYFHAWRYWMKMQLQNVLIEFEATSEADLLVLKDHILVADNTRPETQDGEIVSQNGLVLTTSQDLQFEPGQEYSVYLQYADGTVGIIGVSSSPNSQREMILTQPPAMPLVLDQESFARTTYILVKDLSNDYRDFMVTEKDPQSNFTTVVRAANYSSHYYDHDDDYTGGLVDIGGKQLEG